MTTQSPTQNPKKFYEEASVVKGEQGWLVELDGRSVKTPARQPLLLPTEQLARAIAAEWNEQEDDIDIAAMNLTRLANVALDRVDETRLEMADEFAQYCETDLVCHLAEGPEELVEREEDAWRKVRDWAGEEMDIFLVPVTGVIASPQPDASLNAARDHAYGLDGFRLTGLLYGAALFGSALLALTVEQGVLSAEDAFEVSRIDEAFQADQWGEDAEAKEITAKRREDARSLGVWFRALG
ncbi:MAG: ATP12 family chaperone protein [Hyphomonas sp.]